MDPNVGKRIRELRLSRHLTQQVLAERAGLNEKYLGVIEREGKDIAVSTLACIAVALEVSMADLFAEPTPKDDKNVVRSHTRDILANGSAETVRRLRIFLEEILRP